MKHHLQELIASALAGLQSTGALHCDVPERITIERSRDKTHGDFACNIAMALAKPARRNPRELAQAIVTALPASSRVAKVDIAGPGFINFSLAAAIYHDEVRAILRLRDTYGHAQQGNKEPILLAGSVARMRINAILTAACPPAV